MRRERSRVGGHVRRLALECLEQRALLSAIAPLTLCTAKVEYSHLDPGLVNLVQPIAPVGGAQAWAAAPQVGVPKDQMTFDAAGRVCVRVTALDVEQLLPSLAALGFEATSPHPAQHFVDGFLPTSSLIAANGLSSAGLMGVLALSRPETYTVGSYTDESDNIMEADRTRDANSGLDGTGVRIGVISDSFNALGGMYADYFSGDLPASGVQVLRDDIPGEDEGRAMCQLIHHVAPGASLAFANCGHTEGEMADSIRRLADPSEGNCSIITDDVGYCTEPFFQDGVIAQAVEDVVKNHGVAYFSAAGNQAQNAYESTNVHFVPDNNLGSDACYVFDSGSGRDYQQIHLYGNGHLCIVLQWDQPFYTTSGVQTELDLNLFDANTGKLVALAASSSIVNQAPEQTMIYDNPSDQPEDYCLVITKAAGPDPGRMKYCSFGTNIPDLAMPSSTIVPHAGAADAMAVAAAPFYDQRNPESFTSEGPTTILFAADGTPQAPEVRAKPDILSIDGTTTTFFGNVWEDGQHHFSGTSAAAPHAAAVAALIKQKYPGFTPAQIYSRLKATADPDIGRTPGDPNVVGAGLIDAYRAVVGLPTAAKPNIHDSFDTGCLGQDWEVYNAGDGRTQDTWTDPSQTSQDQLVMDSLGDWGDASLSEAVLHVDAAGTSKLALVFDEKEFDHPDSPMPQYFFGHGNYDGVALSVDGTNWYCLESLTGSASTDDYRHNAIDLSQIAASYHLTLGADTRIKFQCYSAAGYQVGGDGFAFDNVAVVQELNVSVSNVSHKEGNSGTTPFSFAVSIPGRRAAPLELQYATQDGTATAGQDYKSTSGTLTFSPSVSKTTVTVSVRGDNIYENDETFTLNIIDPSTGLVLCQGTGTIVNDDKMPVLHINDVKVKEGNDPAQREYAVFDVTLSNPSGMGVTVHYATADRTAKAGEDYFATAGILTFMPGTTQQTISVPIAGDTAYEKDEQFVVNLSGAVGANMPPAGNGVCTILNDDKMPVLSVADITVDVSPALAPLSAVFTITRTGGTELPLWVSYATSDGTAKAGKQYKAASGTIRFDPGDTEKTVSISVLDLSLASDAFFYLTLSHPKEAMLAAQSKAKCTLHPVLMGPLANELALATTAAAQAGENDRNFQDDPHTWRNGRRS